MRKRHNSTILNFMGFRGVKLDSGPSEVQIPNKNQFVK